MPEGPPIIDINDRPPIKDIYEQPYGGMGPELEALGYGKNPAYDTTMNQALTSALITAPVKVAEGVLSAIDMVNDLASGKPDRMKNQALRESSLYLRDWADKRTPSFEEGSAAYYVHSVVSNVVQNAPWIAAGIATGGIGLIPILGMGATVAGEKYNELKQEGYDDTTAKIAATGYGIAEAIGEKVSIGSLLKFASLGRSRHCYHTPSKRYHPRSLQRLCKPVSMSAISMRVCHGMAP